MRRPTFYVLSVLSLAAVFGQSLLAQAANTKPEDILKQMADYLGKLPKYSCHLESSLDIKAPNEQEQHQVTKMTARVERPNKLALTVTGGQMGLSIISDGKQLTQFLPVLNRYAISEAPASYAEMADIGAPIKPTILGGQTWLIPTGGADYVKELMTGVESSRYIGQETTNGVALHHLRFVEKHFDWDIWIRDGKEPLVDKVVVDMSKEFADHQATVKYSVSFSDWNVAPKFTPADFAFKAPATAQQVDELIESDPPHPLLGKPAPAFKTVGLDGKPFDLKSQIGKNVVILDFWSTSCQPCLMLMPELEATCSLDIGCPPAEFAAFCDAHPDRTVVVYANTSAAVKARADWMVTSSCAVEIVRHLQSQGQKILWAPDRHLGRYIQQETGADMLLWDGACIVHDEFKGLELELMRREHPEARVLVHPESPASVVAQADVVGSTSAARRTTSRVSAMRIRTAPWSSTRTPAPP